MSDLHLRILRLVAGRNQRELNDYAAIDRVEDAASAGHRQELARTAARTRARVSDAQARRATKPSRSAATATNRDPAPL